jgi:large subunit ribosomal protein L4
VAEEEKDEAVVAEAPAKKAPAKKVAAKEAPAKKAPAEKAPAENAAETAPARKPAARPRAGRTGPEIVASPLNVSSFDARGERSGEIRLPESVFGQEPNQTVMHQAYLRQLANARQGTAKTKKRGEVSGGGAKPYRQKGTGRARHGSTREPSWVGGGTVFGPQPRSFAQRMPRKMRRLALRSALAVKANEGRVAILDGFELEEPKTRAVVDLLHAAGVETSALIVLASSNDQVQRSFKVVLARNLSLYDLFTHDHLVITRDSLELLEENFEAPVKSSDFAGTPRKTKEKASK